MGYIDDLDDKLYQTDNSGMAVLLMMIKCNMIESSRVQAVLCRSKQLHCKWTNKSREAVQFIQPFTYHMLAQSALLNPKYWENCAGTQ